MNEVLTGAIAMAMAAAALLFFKFWREAHDRLFLLFAASFLVLALNRAALAIAAVQGMTGDYFYWIRFLAFALILYAIVDKNRSQTRSPTL